MASFSTAICSTVVPRYSVCSRSTPVRTATSRRRRWWRQATPGPPRSPPRRPPDRRRRRRPTQSSTQIGEPDPSLRSSRMSAKAATSVTAWANSSGGVAPRTPSRSSTASRWGICTSRRSARGRAEQSRHPGGRRLPVGAGHVDDRIALVRRPIVSTSIRMRSKPGHSARCGRRGKRVLLCSPCEPRRLPRGHERGPRIARGPLSLGHSDGGPVSQSPRGLPVSSTRRDPPAGRR